jgi:hypothetical protein
VPSNEDHISVKCLNCSRLDPHQAERINDLLELLLLEVTYAISEVIFLHEHLVGVENMSLPVDSLELRKRVKDTNDKRLLDLHYFSHCVGRGLRMEDVCQQRLKTESLACKHGLLVDYALIGKLYSASSLFDEIEVLGYLVVVNYALISIESIQLP